jgi:hypothetical protein
MWLCQALLHCTQQEDALAWAQCTPLRTVCCAVPHPASTHPRAEVDCEAHPCSCCRVAEQQVDAETAAAGTAGTVDQAEVAAVACQGPCRREVQGEAAAAGQPPQQQQTVSPVFFISLAQHQDRMGNQLMPGVDLRVWLLSQPAQGPSPLSALSQASPWPARQAAAAQGRPTAAAAAAGTAAAAAAEGGGSRWSPAEAGPSTQQPGHATGTAAGWWTGQRRGWGCRQWHWCWQVWRCCSCGARAPGGQPPAQLPIRDTRPRQGEA